MSSSECSQASSSTPSLSSYPAEFRGATDYDQTPSTQYLLHHWNHTSTHYYCDECGSLVSTTGGVTYHGTTTTNQDEQSDHDDSPCALFSNRGGSRIHGSPAIRRKRPTLVRMSPIYRLEISQGVESY
ncbi:hypothetical protein FIBSPDRAFT_970061 [Athelia psychrophila]|uniref:C2H2-type domain-containing protein n=1 Tax=Athelia psychrophila TaxID=1759441 RepID=A0A167SYX6_9AGAM|nr:hypothetical protein FIBSPDRAFT_970061 [Fibularhizoctonia sp. CBS 109695]